MKPTTLLLLLSMICPLVAIAQDAVLEHEVIVSHTDERGALQLYRKRADGTGSVQLTQSTTGCRMPSVSPDGKRLVFVEQVGHHLTLQLSDIDGSHVKTLVAVGMNRLPSWMPDGRHIVWMKTNRNPQRSDPAGNSEIHVINTETGVSRRLFTDPEQIQYSNAMPSVSPAESRIAFVSNRSGPFRIWVSDLDGGNARLASKPTQDTHKTLQLPIEQKVPMWSPDGQWIAHWEGVEMIHMRPFTGVKNPERDQQIAATFHVWMASADGSSRRKVGRGDDPTWAPDGRVTRAFPDAKYGAPMVVVEGSGGGTRLPIVPSGRTWGRFCWSAN